MVPVIENPTLAEWLAAQLNAYQWTRSDLAKKLGVTPSTVSRLVDGSTATPSIDTMRGLATAFGVPVLEVMKLVEDTPSRAPAPTAAYAEPAEPDPNVLAAIAADAGLSASDRRLLLSFYERLLGR